MGNLVPIADTESGCCGHCDHQMAIAQGAEGTGVRGAQQARSAKAKCSGQGMANSSGPWWHCIVRFGCDLDTDSNRAMRAARETSNTKTLRNKSSPCGQESVLKVPKRGQFRAAIRVTPKRCDACAQGALGRRTVSWRNFCDAESLAKRYGETCH